MLWVILVVAPFWFILAFPLVTVPPLGLANASVVLARNDDTTRLIFPPFRIRNLDL